MARVLVVEDNPVNLRLAALLLRNAGHTVLCAVDAETGLTLARTERPDLVLMDFQLPGMDGLAATALLKQDPATATIPVIALTAQAITPEPGQTACDAYIAKPLRYQELYAAIARLVGKDARPSHGADTAPPPRFSPGTAGVRAMNVGILEGLVGRDPAVISEFLDAFRTSAAAIALDLKTACKQGRPEQAGRQAHKLKSAAHAVGAQELAGLCAEMESAGKANNAEALTALLPGFEREIVAVNADIDSLTMRN